MVYYSAPITPAVTKATVVDADTFNVGTTPRVSLNVPAPDYGTTGTTATVPVSTFQAVVGHGRGSASITKPPTDPQLTVDDCTNVVTAIGDDRSSDTSNTGTVLTYEFVINGALVGAEAGSVRGSADNPACYLWDWPANRYGASLENRPDNQGGPWNPYDDDPNVSAPPTATGWEIVEPGYVTDYYLVRWYATTQDDNDTVGAQSVGAYITTKPGLNTGNWTAYEAQQGAALDSWDMPPPEQGVNHWATPSLAGLTLPATAYVYTDLYRAPAGGTGPWQWRYDNTIDRGGRFSGGAQLLVVFLWQPPVYRWILSEPPPPLGIPPLRTVQRGGDGLGASSAPRAVQRQTRQATNRAVSCF